MLLESKKIFLIMFTGGTLEMLKNKLTRVCDSLGASKF